jgi:hypothetical protein
LILNRLIINSDSAGLRRIKEEWKGLDVPAMEKNDPNVPASFL